MAKYQSKMTRRTVATTWEIWTYDVWGNADDGYEVNDRCCVDRACELELPIEVCNVGTPAEFETAHPTPEQMMELWGVSESDGQGDDLTLYFEDEGGRPLGEMNCVSHESLSPIKPIA